MRRLVSSRTANRFHAVFEFSMAVLGFWLAWAATRGVKDWDFSRHEHVIVAASALLAVLFAVVALLFLARSLRALRRGEGGVSNVPPASRAP